MNEEAKIVINHDSYPTSSPTTVIRLPPVVVDLIVALTRALELYVSARATSKETPRA